MDIRLPQWAKAAFNETDNTDPLNDNSLQIPVSNPVYNLLHRQYQNQLLTLQKSEEFCLH